MIEKFWRSTIGAFILNSGLVKTIALVRKYYYNYGHWPLLSQSTIRRFPNLISLLIYYWQSTCRLDRSRIKFFPLAEKGSYFTRPLYSQDGKEGFFSLFYQTSQPDTVFNGSLDMAYYKTEICWARQYEAGEEFHDVIESKCLIPISFLNSNINQTPSINTDPREDYRLSITVDGTPTQLSKLAQNRYHFISFKEGEEVKLIGNSEMLIGKPFAVDQKCSKHKKLVLLIFVDNLGAGLTSGDRFPEIMPNTHKFFQQGHIFENHFINGHWTLDSFASIFTGKYPAHHKVFHPRKRMSVAQGNYTLSQAYQDQEYLTFHIGGNQRVAPHYGYAHGFDRTIFGRHQPCEEIVANALEQLMAFPNRSQFGLIDFMDLHRDQHVQGLYPQSLMSRDAHGEIGTANKNSPGLKIRQKSKSFDEQYLAEARRLDFFMGPLYEFLGTNFEYEDYLVALVSDHGYWRSDDDDELLTESRIRTPFMIAGGGVRQGCTTSVTENIDIYPTLLQLSGISSVPGVDGTIPPILVEGTAFGKNTSYTEAIYPGQCYRAAISDGKMTLLLESEGKVNSRGNVVIGNFKTKVRGVSIESQPSFEVQETINGWINIFLRHTEPIRLDKSR